MILYIKKTTLVLTALTGAIAVAMLSVDSYKDKSNDNETKTVTQSTTEASAPHMESNVPEKSLEKITTQPIEPELLRRVEAGETDAEYELAYRYENGVGVPKDEEKALELYKAAAKHDR